MAVVGERVEAEVDAVVDLEIFVDGEARREIDAVGRDAVFFEKGLGAEAVGALGREQEKFERVTPRMIRAQSSRVLSLILQKLLRLPKVM